MPVKAEKRGNAWRVVEVSTGKITNKKKHATRQSAQSQATAINLSLKRKGKI